MTRLALISALASEARCFSNNSSFPVKTIIKLDHADLFICGIGAGNARTAALVLINNGAKAIVSWGTAGALCSTLNPGDVIIPETIVGEKKCFQTSSNWRQQLIKKLSPNFQVHTGKLIQSESVICSISDKQQLKESSAAIAVDMESAAIAKIAAQHEVAMIAIRVIVDSASETIPTTATQYIDEFGRTNPQSLIKGLLSHPGDIPALLKLGTHFKLAQKTLRKIVIIANHSLALPSNISK